MEKICPELLFTGSGALLKNKVLIHDHGTIHDIRDQKEFDNGDLHFFTGIVCPGFINTHCHLELSHMKGKADTGTGLLPFLKKVVGFRDIEQEVIDFAISEADKEMYENGIVVVGDISNKIDTALTKNHSRIKYHTFVEYFDFMQPSLTDKTIAQYDPVFENQSRENGNKVSRSPHAPYTVSPKLFNYLNDTNKDLKNVTISIHNQETVHEDNFFLHKHGDFISFYEDFGMQMDHFHPTGKHSIYYAINHMDSRQRTLFVHNTCSTAEDIEAAQNWNSQLFWATCPNANLYIENKLPDYQLFLDADAAMTIGTDSLTSNWQLCILEEIKTIHKFQSYIPLNTLLQWATSNGANALGFGDTHGYFSKGTKPGINLINCAIRENEIDLSEASVIRLA